MNLLNIFKKKDAMAMMFSRIEKLERAIGEEESSRTDNLLSWGFTLWIPSSIRSEIKQLRADFEELDKKFDALERYLQIELVKGTEETQTYDWANKKEIFEFRKCAKTYEQLKAAKEDNE